VVAPEIACEPWLGHLRTFLPISDEGQDPEGVHQVRVAAARLRVWLRLGDLRVLGDDLRWLRGAAGEVRDLDVLLGMGGPEGYEQALLVRWSAARAGWLQALRSGRTQGLLEALSVLPPIDGRRALRRTRRWQTRLRRRGDALDWSAAPEGDLHAFRRAVRRLRYAREWIGAPDAAIKELSEDLGQLNDLFVLRELLSGGELPVQGAPRPEEVVERIRAQRERFASSWSDHARALRRRPE